MSTHRRRSYRDFAEMSGFEIELPSSPDPLADEADDGPNDHSVLLPPSTTRGAPFTNRRLLHTNATASSSRFSALPGTSPRKRMFALDVGNEITPQTIFVTVEAGQDGNPIIPKAPVGSSVRRRLFGSPTPSQASPQRRVRTTTTTVPLRGLTDDEGDPTPKQRRRSAGRPGTPKAASPNKKKKKKGTPTPKTKSARKPRGTPTNPSSDNLQSDPPTAADRPSPAKRRGRPPKRKSTDATSENGDPNSIQTLPRKRGRKPRESLGPDQLALLYAANNNGVAPSRTLDAPGEPMSDPAMANDGLHGEQPGDEEDVWMADTTDPPASTRRDVSEKDGDMEFSEPAEAQPEDRNPSELDDQDLLPQGKPDDYAPMMDYDDRSDVETPHSAAQVDAPPDHDELNEQGPLTDKPDYYAPMDHHDGSDAGSRHNQRQADASSDHDELHDQGPLPGESDDYALMSHSDRSEAAPRQGGSEPPFRRHSAELEDQVPLPGESDDYAPIMEYDERSEAESEDSKRTETMAHDEPDLTVDPETFTMIGIESTSFRTSRNEPTSEPPEMDVETSLFINKTLDLLKPEIIESDEEEVDILVSRGHTPARDEPERPMAGTSSARTNSPLPQSPANRSSRYSSRSPGRTESEPGSVARLRRRAYVQASSQTAQRIDAYSPESDANRLIDDEDSFSDIPEEVLAAVGSRDDWQGSRVGTEVQLDPVSTTEQSAMDSGQDHLLSLASVQASSLSSSPQSRPSPSRRAREDTIEDLTLKSASRSARSQRSSGQVMQRSSPPPSARSRTDSNRLLTPDDTTSSSTGPQSPTTRPTASHTALHQNDRPTSASDDIGSSPPQITTFVEEDDQLGLPARRNSDTPANQAPDIHVEFVQERQTLAAAPQSTHLFGPRPTLSPVKRIGRTLQEMLSDPPSPSARSSVLGSPFRGSVKDSSPLDGAAVDEALRNAALSDGLQPSQPSQNVSQPSEPPIQSLAKSWALPFTSLSQIKKMVTQGVERFTSPQVNNSQHAMDDPFGPSSPTAERGVDTTRDSAFMNRIREASREGSAPSSRFNGRTVVDNGEAQRTSIMSPAIRSPGLGQGRSPRPRSGGSESSQSRTRRHVDAPSGYDGAYDENAGELARDQPREDLRGIDHWSEDEQMGVESERGSEQDFEQWQMVEAEAQHHDVQAEDETRLDDAPAATEESEDEDIWAVEANRTASSPQPLAPQNELSNLFRKSELSIDWGTRSTNSQVTTHPGRSPAFKSRRSVREDPPENLDDYSLVDLHSGTSTQSSVKKPTPRAQAQSKRVDLSDFFSSSPNFIERQRRAKEASLAKSATQHAAANAAHVVLPEMTQVQNAGLSVTGKLPSPAPGASQDTTRESTTHMSSTPEQADRSQATEKGLTPTPQHERTDAALFETWSVSSRPPTGQPPSSDPREASARPSTPQDPFESSFDTPDLRPLPGRAASPSKSCLRSPLKPRTPGRVVEFKSSTSSAAGPSKANANLQNNVAMASASNPFAAGPFSTFPGKENQPNSMNTNGDNDLVHAGPPSSFLGKENQSATVNVINDSDVAHASPRNRTLQQPEKQQQQQSVDSPLSQTGWSRRHWLLLDSLLQSYRRDGPLEFELRHPDAVMASPSRRASSSLLGKEITSQGETMLIEQWHLDVVDAFRQEVGGWPEDVLAKRLFALIVGEERRRAGLVPRRR